MASPKTRRKTVPGARRRTSLCADGLGRGHRHTSMEPRLVRSSAQQSLHELQVGVGDYEPLRAGAFEVDLHARVRAAALTVEHDALAELAMTHALPEPHAAFGRQSGRTS